MWVLYIPVCVCVCVCVCEVVLCSCSVTLPSFLLFSNPSCMGQRMERASIWAPSPAYLLDTQVGTTHSSPLSPLRAPHPTSLLPFFSLTMLTLSTLCVCTSDMACLSFWNTSFSHVGDFHAILLFRSVSCVHFGCWASGLVSELVCCLTYHTLCCGCVKWGCQWICVCYFVLCWLFCCLIFFCWGL